MNWRTRFSNSGYLKTTNRRKKFRLAKSASELQRQLGYKNYNPVCIFSKSVFQRAPIISGQNDTDFSIAAFAILRRFSLSIIKQNKYDPDKLHIEDFELWNRLSRKGYNLANINEYLIEYRWHESNVSVKNSDVQYRAKCNLIKSQISELIGREPTPKEIALHEFSFRLYDKGHRCDAIHSVSELADEKNWLMELSAANDNAMQFGKSHFRAVLLSRWIVCCVAFGKYLQLLSLPPVFYTPDTLFKAAMLLIQK